MKMYLASGTDEMYMKEEARLLDVDALFRWRRLWRSGRLQELFERNPDSRASSRAPSLQGSEFLGFGDGYVEIEEVKTVGGVAVGVASAEPDCLAVDGWKRQRLIGRRRGLHRPQFPVPRRTDFDALHGLKDAVQVQDIRPLAASAAAIERTRAQLTSRPLAVSRRRRRRHIDTRSCRRLPRVWRGRNPQGAARILIMGAHVIRAGVNRHIIDLMERGYIDHIAMNGAGGIHDYELARIGATTESVDALYQNGRVRPVERDGRDQRLGQRSRGCRDGLGREHGTAYSAQRISAPRL